MFAGMRVAVEEAVAEDHLHPRLGHPVGELASLLERRRVEVEIGELDAVQELERQHARARSRSSRPSGTRTSSEPAKLRRNVSAFRASSR